VVEEVDSDTRVDGNPAVFSAFGACGAPPGTRQPNARFLLRRLASGRLLRVKHGVKIDAHEGRVQSSAVHRGRRAGQGAHRPDIHVEDAHQPAFHPPRRRRPEVTLFVASSGVASPRNAH